jgi:hypothetical protein
MPLPAFYIKEYTMKQGDKIKIKLGDKIKIATFLSEQEGVIFCTVNGYAPLQVAKENVIKEKTNV